VRFAGTVDIGAPRARVWTFMTDPMLVTACAPELQSIDISDPHHFKVVVRAGVGPIKGTFTMNVQFIELRSPNHAVVLARGWGPGSAVEIVSTMDLGEFDAQRTIMEWTSDVTVSGMIAQVGSRLIEGAADKITQQVFACIKAKLEEDA
jgi:uncharacterized protein